MKKATTASMSSQACSPRKDSTWPAALKMKLTIEPMSPGRREPSFWPTALRPCPTAFVPALRTLSPARARAPRTKPTARTMACRVQPYFLKISYTLSSRGLCLSRASISSLTISNSSFRTASLSLAAALSLGEVFSSSMMRMSSVMCSLSSAAFCLSSSRGCIASFCASSWPRRRSVSPLLRGVFLMSCCSFCACWAALANASSCFRFAQWSASRLLFSSFSF